MYRDPPETHDLLLVKGPFLTIAHRTRSVLARRPMTVVCFLAILGLILWSGRLMGYNLPWSLLFISWLLYATDRQLDEVLVGESDTFGLQGLEGLSLKPWLNEYMGRHIHVESLIHAAKIAAIESSILENALLR